SLDFPAPGEEEMTLEEPSPTSPAPCNKIFIDESYDPLKQSGKNCRLIKYAIPHGKATIHWLRYSDIDTSIKNPGPDSDITLRNKSDILDRLNKATAWFDYYCIDITFTEMLTIAHELDEIDQLWKDFKGKITRDMKTTEDEWRKKICTFSLGRDINQSFMMIV